MAEFVSLFSGAGGLDHGLELAGWTCLFATDNDSNAVSTLRRNAGRRFGGKVALALTKLHQGDVAELDGRRILTDIGKRRGQVDLLAGGPPCQSWSSAGHQLGFADPRGRLFGDYIRIASALDVRWLVFENVRGLLTARGHDGIPGSALNHIREELLKVGWRTKIDLLNAADYGVPQRRVRLIILGYRSGDEPTLPKPTHSKERLLAVKEWVSLGETLGKLPPLENDEIIRPSPGLLKELSRLTPGAGVKSPGKKETTRPGGHWGYKQGAFLADLRLPARTVTASSQQDWIIDPSHGIRRLTPRECAAIQSFPDGWEFNGTRSDHYRLIGNAVPPMLAEAIGRELKCSLDFAKANRSAEIRLARQLEPLPPRLQAAIEYTRRDSERNGESRRVAGKRKFALAG